MNRLLLGTALVSGFLPFGSAFAQTTTETDDEIVVTASPIARNLSDVAVGVSVINKEQLDERLAGTIGETIKNQPGVSSTFFGPGASRPVIRGQSDNRIAILTNGLGALDASATSPDHAVSIEPAAAERVEIIRGPGILRFGSAAAGGVVNILDSRIKTAVPDAPLNANLRVGGTSVDEGLEAAAAGDVTLFGDETNALVLHLDGAHRESNNYDIPGYAESALMRALEEEEHEDEDEEEHEDEHEEEESFRTVENSATETSALGAGLTYVFERGHFGLAIKDVRMEYGVPGHHHHDEEDEEHSEEEELVSIDLKQTRYDLDAALDIGSDLLEKVTFRLGYGDYEHTELEGDEIGTVFTNEGWESRLELQHAPFGNWRGALGIHYLTHDFAAIGVEAFTPPTTTDQTGVYLFEELDTGPFLFELAGRYETTDHENVASGESLSFDTGSVSAGMIFRAGDNSSLGATIFRAERAPGVEELFSDGAHLATNQYEIGDASLDVETATGIEGRAVFSTDVSRVEVNAFTTQYDGYIYQRPTDEVLDELPVFRFSADDAVFSGFEVAASRVLGTVNGFEVSGDASAEYVRAILTGGSEDTDLPRIPPLGLTAGLSFDGARLSLRGEAEFVSEQDEIAEFELPTDSYTLVNILGSYRFSDEETAPVLRIGLMNIGDEEARQHASPLKDLIPLPGRNIRVSLSMSF